MHRVCIDWNHFSRHPEDWEHKELIEIGHLHHIMTYDKLTNNYFFTRPGSGSSYFQLSPEEERAYVSGSLKSFYEALKCEQLGWDWIVEEIDTVKNHLK